MLYAQDSNRRHTTITSSEETSSSRPVTDEDTELALQQAASQHPAVYCDFILTLLEDRTSYLRDKRFTDELTNVLAKATATEELAPFYEIPGGIADTITALRTRATREIRCDRLSLTCRALRLQRSIALQEAVKRFLLVQLPRPQIEADREPCPPQLYDYAPYYQFGADLLESLNPTAETRSASEAFNVVSVLVSSISTTRDLRSFLMAIERLPLHREILGHIASTLPAAVSRISPSAHDFTPAGLGQQFFSSLSKVCVTLRANDLPISPLLEAHKVLISNAFQTDMCGLPYTKIPDIYLDPVNTFNTLFSGPTSQLNVFDAPIPHITELQLARRNLLKHRAGKWIWEDPEPRKFLNRLKRLHFDGENQRISEEVRRTNTEWGVAFTSILLDLGAFEADLKEDPVFRFAFRYHALQGLLEAAQTNEHKESVQQELQRLLLTANPWHRIPASLWLYYVRRYHGVVLTRGASNALNSHSALPPELRLQHYVVDNLLKK